MQRKPHRIGFAADIAALRHFPWSPNGGLSNLKRRRQRKSPLESLRARSLEQGRLECLVQGSGRHIARIETHNIRDANDMTGYFYGYGHKRLKITKNKLHHVSDMTN
jgi:hypothetical protein